jgi:hypothetical protein
MGIEKIKLYAWVGPDEFGSGEIGLKQARVPAGMIPIVAIKEGKVNTQQILEQLDLQGKTYGTRISLCEFEFKQVIKEVGKL